MPFTQLTGSATTTVKVPELNAILTQLNTDMATFATKAELEELKARVTHLEQTPLSDHGHLDLSERVAALEARPDTTTPANTADGSLLTTMPMLGPPADIDPDEITLVYDKATIYYKGLELHAVRVAENTWRLVAQLNYVTINQILWTYDELVTGTPDEVYAHAAERMAELARLKPKHDEVHDRVKEMSEGEP